MKNPYIILIPVRYFDARKTCNELENQVFLTIPLMRSQLPVGTFIYSLTEFMEDFNDEKIVADDFFMGYVWVGRE